MRQPWFVFSCWLAKGWSAANAAKGATPLNYPLARKAGEQPFLLPFSGDSRKEVGLGTGVTTIYAAAFRYCYALENIKCKATTPPTIAEDTFLGLGINPVIYVPMAVVDDYKAATYWSDLADIITGYEE